MWSALPRVRLALPLIYCLLFGALISPTHTTAVMGIGPLAKWKDDDGSLIVRRMEVPGIIAVAARAPVAGVPVRVTPKLFQRPRCSWQVLTWGELRGDFARGADPRTGLVSGDRRRKRRVFLLSLVLCASMMPVIHLPVASWPSGLGLGFVSAMFDNIPLTALAIKQGDTTGGCSPIAWASAVQWFGFGSLAGVALSSLFPEARKAVQWVTQGWHVAVAYVVGFFGILAITGWVPTVFRAS